jgi:hypothetical protein
MNKAVLSADLNLIQALLNCPQGEEWELLKRHEQLINPELLQVMSQIAASLGAEGAIADADKLRYWENQLAQVIAPTKPTAPQPTATQPSSTAPPQPTSYPTPYLNLIQALLDCPEGQETTLLKANQGLVNAELVQVMQSVGAQLETRGNQQAANFLRHWAQQIDRALHQPHQIPHIPTERLAYKQNGHRVTAPTNVQEILNPGLTPPPETPPAQQAEPIEPPTAIHHAHYDPLPSPWDGEATQVIPPLMPPPVPSSVPNSSVETQLAAIVQGLAQLEKTIADRSTVVYGKTRTRLCR